MVLEIVLGLIALTLVLTLPGYFLTLAFFPKKNEIDSIERITFSLVFSIAFTPLLLLIENQVFSIPINFLSSFLTVTGIILIGLIVWMIRVQKLRVPEKVYTIFPKVEKEEAVNLLWFK
jgi:uncharacterized membrane protein